MNIIEEIQSKEYYLNFTLKSSYFCVFLDFMLYLIMLFILRAKNNSISLLKYRLYILFIVDIIFRISFIKTYFLVDSFEKELIFALLSSSKLYIILSFLEEIPNKIQISWEKNNFENLEPFQKSTIFFFIIFSYAKFAKGFTKEINLIQNLAFLGYLFKIYVHVRNKIYEIILILKIQNKINDFNLKEYIILNPLITFIFCYCIKIANLFIEDSIIFNIFFNKIKDNKLNINYII